MDRDMKPIGVRFSENDRPLYEDLQAYSKRRGLPMAAAVRDLISTGLARDLGQREDAKDVLLSLQAQLRKMSPRLAKDGRIYRTIMITVLESVMISRRMAAAVDQKLLQSAQAEALKAFREVEHDGWL